MAQLLVFLPQLQNQSLFLIHLFVVLRKSPRVVCLFSLQQNLELLDLADKFVAAHFAFRHGLPQLSVLVFESFVLLCQLAQPQVRCF